MPDFADEAQKRTDEYLAAALSLQQHRPQEEQHMKDGVILCLECGEPIPLARLRALPDAVRCVGCQETHEATEAA